MEGIFLLSGNVIQSAIRAGTPLLLATVGEIYSERSGVLNLGVEGMMIMGTVSGYISTFITLNPWIGIITSCIVGGLFSLIHAFVSITLKGNQVISGLAITMLGLGLSSLLGRPYVGTTVQDYGFRQIKIPLLSDMPLIGPAFFSSDPIVYIGIIVAIGLWYILFKTKYGLIIRSVGENPSAADSLGINVFRVRYICVLIGGSLAGLAGAHLSIAYSTSWSEGMTLGRGWIAVGLTIFAIWHPLRAIIGSYLFGLIDIMQFRLQPFGIPPSLLAMLPYIFTIGALLVGASERTRKRIGSPKALSEPYIRGEKS